MRSDGAANLRLAYAVVWNGDVLQPDANGSYTNPQFSRLPAMNYRLKFSALKHFGNRFSNNDFETYYTPPFRIYY